MDERYRILSALCLIFLGFIFASNLIEQCLLSVMSLSEAAKMRQWKEVLSRVIDGKMMMMMMMAANKVLSSVWQWRRRVFGSFTSPILSTKLPMNRGHFFQHSCFFLSNHIFLGSFGVRCRSSTMVGRWESALYSGHVDAFECNSSTFLQQLRGSCSH